MDLALSAEQQALRDLAREIFAARCSDDRLREVEAGDERYDPDLWAELARSNLLGVGVPESLGGIGGGIIEAVIVAEEAGRAAAPVPLVAALTGALATARGGSERHLAGYVGGGAPIIPALAEPDAGDPYDVTSPVRNLPDGYYLDGTKTFVPSAERASALLVPARGDDAPMLFLVDPADVFTERQDPTGSAPLFQVDLPGVKGEHVPGDHGRLVDEAIVLACAHQVGVVDRALELTATYTSERQQFGKPIATFQAVQQRAADAFIDVQAMRWTMWEAAWRLSVGEPARTHVSVAKVWAAEGAARVIAAAQHLHGGMGVDMDYPLHRYTYAARQGELVLGGAGPHLQRLGDALA